MRRAWIPLWGVTRLTAIRARRFAKVDQFANSDVWQGIRDEASSREMTSILQSRSASKRPLVYHISATSKISSSPSPMVPRGKPGTRSNTGKNGRSFSGVVPRQLPLHYGQLCAWLLCTSTAITWLFISLEKPPTMSIGGPGRLMNAWRQFRPTGWRCMANQELPQDFKEF